MSDPILDDFSELDDSQKDLNPQDKSFITNFYVLAHFQIITVFAALITALASDSFGFAFLLVSSISSIIGLATSYWAIEIKFKKGVRFGLSAISLPLLFFFNLLIYFFFILLQQQYPYFIL